MIKNNYVEQTEKLLEKQADSALKSYDSAQDSLDKAYLTIVFGCIAFYSTKLALHQSKDLANFLLIFDIMSISLMCFTLICILISFAISKSMMKTLYDAYIMQINLLSADDGDLDGSETSVLSVEMERNFANADRKNEHIEFLNWIIPCLTLLSATMCFIKSAISPCVIQQYRSNIQFGFTIYICIAFVGVYIYLRLNRRYRTQTQDGNNLASKSSVKNLLLVLFGAIIALIIRGDKK